MKAVGWPAWLPARPTVLLRVSVGVVLVVMAGMALVIPSNLSAAPLFTRVAGVFVGGAIAVSGMVIWERRSGNAIGPALVLTGALWIVGRLQGAPVGPIALAANLANSATQVIVLAVLLSFPTGHLPSRAARVIVAWALVTTIVGNYLFASSVEILRLTGERNPIYLALDPVVHRASIALFQVAAYVGAIVGVGWLAARWLRSSGPARRSFVPIFLAGVAITIVVVGCQLVINTTALTDEQLYGLVTVQLLSFVLLPAAIAWSVLQGRMARGAVADLVLRLGETPEPLHLRSALAAALHDPTLEVVHWSNEAGAYVDTSGDPVELPGRASGRGVALLEGDHGPLAAIIHDPALADDPGLVAAVGAAVRLTVENERLQAEVEAQLDDVRASRARIVTAGDAERRRLERDLHDGAQQRLVALSLALRRASSQAGPAGDARLTASLEDATQLVRDALAELRELARGIHPAVLTESGLAGALRVLATAAPVEVKLAEVPAERFAPEVEATAYFFVSEALANVAKHAPEATARVSIRREPGHLAVEVSDDGPGGARREAGSGLQGLDDRVAAAGGRFELVSAPGAGTTLRARIPVAAPPSEIVPVQLPTH